MLVGSAVSLMSLVIGSGAASQVQSQTAGAAAGNAAAAEPTDGSGQEIVVTGVREGQRKAVDQKRRADNVVEALYANDVGKLPDQNVAEAVRRLPGLSVANDQGEGRYVIIRGIDPNLVNVTLNGQTLPAPEPDGRQVKLDDLPSAMINAVIVTKSLLPSQDANAIGGEVNIQTLTAFDRRERLFFDARGAIGWYDRNHKKPVEADGQIGGRFGADETIGAVLSVNYSRRPIESENFQATEGWSLENGVDYPDEGGLRDYSLVRTRLGVVGNLDWRPNDATKLWLRSSYSQFKDSETRDQNRLDNLGFSGGATGTFEARGAVLVRRRREDDNTRSVTLGGDLDLPVGQLSASGGWTRAVKRDPIRSEFRFRTGSGDVTGDYDVSRRPFVLDPLAAADLTLYSFNSLNLETRRATERLWQGRADYTLPLASMGDGSAIKLGFKYLDRRKRNDQNRLDYGGGDADFTLDQVAYTGDRSFYGNDFSFGPRIGYGSARDYVDANPDAVELDEEGTIADTLADDYDVRERVTAGYAMATLRFGGLSVIPGVRVEHTRDRTSAKAVDGTSTADDGYNLFARKSYTNWFPGLNVKYDAGSDLVVRGAVTTAIGRPNYPDLTPHVLVEDDDVPSITLGNPDLDPYKALNVDASAEYYPSSGSILAVGLFYKHIDHPIYPFTQRVTGGTYAGQAYAEADVTQPINADDEVLRGIELNAQYQFTHLPGFWGGFGVSANYTHVTGHAKAPGIREGNLPLAFQSREVANAQLFYEKYGFAARVAYTYRAHYLDALGGDEESDQFTGNNGQLDVHASYQLTPHFTVFADGTNLTDAAWRRYIGSRNRLIERERYSFMLRCGVQVQL